MSSSEYDDDNEQNQLQSEEIPSDLEQMYGGGDGDDDEEMDSEELRDFMKNKNQNDYSDMEENSQENSEENSQENSEQNSEEQNSEEIDEQFLEEQNLNEEIRNIQGKTGQEQLKILKHLFQESQKNQKSQKSLQKDVYFQKVQKKIDNLTEDELQYYENDKEDFEKSLQSLQKALLENNFSYFNQYKLLSSKKSTLEIGEGIGFLNSKTLIFQEYLINLHIYLLKKLQGETIDLEFVKNMLYQKILLQKMKPVEKKLDYQIQKLLKFAQKRTKNNNNNEYTDLQDKKSKQNNNNDLQDEESDIDDEMDPYNFKAKPSELQQNQNQENQISKILNKGKADDNTPKYVAPKLVPVLSKENKEIELEKRKEERRKQYLRRQLAENLVNDTNTENQREIKNSQHQRIFANKAQLERERFEEENFMRLPETRKDKALQRLHQRKLEIGGERLDDFTEQRQIRELLSYENIIGKNKNDTNKGYLKQNLKKKNNNSQAFMSNSKRKNTFKGGKQQGKKKVKR